MVKIWGKILENMGKNVIQSISRYKWKNILLIWGAKENGVGKFKELYCISTVKAKIKE